MHVNPWGRMYTARDQSKERIGIGNVSLYLLTIDCTLGLSGAESPQPGATVGKTLSI